MNFLSKTIYIENKVIHMTQYFLLSKLETLHYVFSVHHTLLTGR